MSDARKRYAQMIKEILEVIKKYEDLRDTEYGSIYEQLKNTAEATLTSLLGGEKENKEN